MVMGGGTNALWPGAMVNAPASTGLGSGAAGACGKGGGLGSTICGLDGAAPSAALPSGGFEIGASSALEAGGSDWNPDSLAAAFVLRPFGSSTITGSRGS
jgi:hypothetical protein